MKLADLKPKRPRLADTAGPGRPVKLLGIYDKKNLNVGAGTRTSRQVVVVKDTATGRVLGRRPIWQK